MKYFWLIILSLVSFTAGYFITRPESCGAACTPVIESLAPSGFHGRTLAPGITLIDIRTADEFNSGHISGAVSSDFYQTDLFNQYLDSLDKTKAYLIYCRTGNRSGKALKIMSDRGFTRVADLAGGISAWQSAGFSLEK